MKSSKQWSAQERFQAVVATANMADEELGAWCRTNGLHREQLALWHEQCLAGVRPGRKQDVEKKRLLQKNKQLEKELARKDKALAETAAMIVLKKKAEALFAAYDDAD